MSLTQIFEAVREAFTAEGGKADWKLGGEHLLANDSPPRIVWVPVGGPFGPVDKGGLNPRPLRTRNLAVQVHCWGKDTDATDDLVNRLAAAAHHAAGGSVGFDSERWPDLNNELLALGRVAIVGLTFRVPVTAPVRRTTTPTTATTTPEFES